MGRNAKDEQVGVEKDLAIGVVVGRLVTAGGPDHPDRSGNGMFRDFQRGQRPGAKGSAAFLVVRGSRVINRVVIPTRKPDRRQIPSEVRQPSDSLEHFVKVPQSVIMTAYRRIEPEKLLP
jgi:hypothetical protein